MSQGELAEFAKNAVKLKEANRNKRSEYYLERMHDGQEKVHKSKSRFICVWAGNRFGKSVCGTMEMRWRVLGDHPMKRVKVPIKVLMICTDFENHSKKVIEPKIHEWFPPEVLKKCVIDRNQSKALKTIKFPNGSIIDFASQDQDMMVFEASDYDLVWCDEPPAQNIFKAVWRGLTDRGGTFLMTGTPIVQGWMIKEYKKWKAGNVDGVDRLFILGKTEDNAHNLGDGDIELGMKRISEFAAMLPPEEREARLEGKPLELQGAVFPSWAQDTHMCKPFEWPQHWPIYESIDPHPRKPAGYSLIGIAENGAKILLYSAYLPGDVVELGNEILLARASLNISGGRSPKIIKCLIDNAANAPLVGKSINNNVRDRVSVREELEFIIGPSVGGPRIEAPQKSVQGKIDAMKSWLTIRKRSDDAVKPRPDFFVFDTPENVPFIDEIEGYMWAKYKTKEYSGYKDAPIKRDDDIIDSVMQVALSMKSTEQNNTEIASIFRKRRNSHQGNNRGARSNGRRTR